jgi:hypothetical protein
MEVKTLMQDYVGEKVTMFELEHQPEEDTS